MVGSVAKNGYRDAGVAVSEQGRLSETFPARLKYLDGCRCPLDRCFSFCVALEEVAERCLIFGSLGQESPEEIHHPQELAQLLDSVRARVREDGFHFVG